MKLSRILGFALGPIASAAIALIMVPVVAWTFTAEDVGRLNVLQVTLSFFLLLIMLGLDQAYVREFHESDDPEKLLKSCITPGFMLLVLSGIISASFSAEISQFLYGTKNSLFYWITLACLATAFLARFLSLILRMQERGLAFSMSQIIPKLLLLIIIGVILLFELPRTFLTLLLAFFASSIAVVFIYFWNTRNQWRPALKTSLVSAQIRSLLRFGTPLIFSGIAYWGLATTSSISLRYFSTFSELGIYSITTSVAGVAAIFQSIFSVVWAPIVYKWVAEGVDLSRVDRVARQALAAVCAIILLCGTLSWLTDYLLPIEYRMVKYLVLCAIIQPLFYTLSEITCIGIGITRRTTLTIWVTLAALCTNLLLSAWLVPLHGASGAIISNTVAYLVFFIARTEASAYAWRKFPRFELYFLTSLVVIFSVATVTLGPSIPVHYSLFWLSLTPIAAWHFRIELLELISASKQIWNKRAKIQNS